MTGIQWPQSTPYASPFMAPPPWPMYMLSYMPRPLTQLPYLQAPYSQSGGELARPRRLSLGLFRKNPLTSLRLSLTLEKWNPPVRRHLF